MSKSKDIEIICKAVSKEGGKCNLTDLLPIAKEETGIPEGTLLSFIEEHNDRLAIERLEDGGIMAHTINRTWHEFGDQSLGSMFHTLYRMTYHYRRQPWPKTVASWEGDYSGALRLTESPSKILVDLKDMDYVKENEGNTLKWDVPRICSAVNRMPWRFRKGFKPIEDPPKETVKNAEAEAPEEVEDDDVYSCDSDDSQAGMIRVKRGHTLLTLPGFTLKTGNTDCMIVADMDTLDLLIKQDRILRASPKADGQYAAIDCQGVPEKLELFQVATTKGVYIFDCRFLGAKAVCGALKPFLTSKSHFKLIHDLHSTAVALHKLGSTELLGVIDTQIVAEHLWGGRTNGLNDFLKNIGVPTHSSKDFVEAKMKAGVDLWCERPVPRSYLVYAAKNVSLLFAAAKLLQKKIKESHGGFVQASGLRFRSAVSYDGLRSIGFDKTDHYSLASAELLKVRPAGTAFLGEPLKVECEVDGVISLLPRHLQTKLTQTKQHGEDDAEQLSEIVDAEQLSEIFLDLDRPAQCWAKGKRHFLSDDNSHVVTLEDLKYITDQLGEFGSDNRAGLNSTLHRFSAMRDRFGEILGISIRIGRHVHGNAAMLMDFLLGTDKSILILGEPGSGKTTIVREATRILAKTKNVIVVDTSNEIAGDGRRPHSCIGLARRMMVPSLEQQSSVMIECVQNHTPECIVIDEIGRPQEVHAARTAKQRGVRLIASAHGDLRNLIKNKELNGLVGGTEKTTLGDDMAREEAKRKGLLHNQDDKAFPISKTKVERGGSPTFEVVIEVRRGARHEWRVVADSAKAVDSILDLGRYRAQKRTRNAETGDMQMELVDA